MGVAVGDDLKRLRPGFEIAQPARCGQPTRLADELIGRDPLALDLAAQFHRRELAAEHVAGFHRHRRFGFFDIVLLSRRRGRLCPYAARHRYCEQSCENKS